jgi:hypothetical protein
MHRVLPAEIIKIYGPLERARHVAHRIGLEGALQS